METQDVFNFVCKADRTLVKSEKKSADSIVISTFLCIAEQGMFAKYSKHLESIVFGAQSWQTFATGELRHSWLMRLTDIKTNEKIIEIKGCVIEDVKLTRGKESLIEVKFSIQHEKTKDIATLVASISSSMMMSLSIDNTVMEDATNATETEEAE